MSSRACIRMSKAAPVSTVSTARSSGLELIAQERADCFAYFVFLVSRDG